MNIIDALRIEKGSVVAIVGAGGKTSLMIALANALTKPVYLTTTTKLAYSEGLGSMTHLAFTEFEDGGGIKQRDTGIFLVTNSLDQTKQKWVGLSLSQSEFLISTCKQRNVPCLIEADGARRLSLKAPEKWEPVIPPLVDLVVVVVGLSVIGRPLNAETVFRPEVFGELTDLSLGDPVRLKHILRMLNHSEGGLKCIPPSSRAAVVFNQADAHILTPEEMDLIRNTLNDNFSAAILTSLRTDPENCEVIFNRNHLST